MTTYITIKLHTLVKKCSGIKIHDIVGCNLIFKTATGNLVYIFPDIIGLIVIISLIFYSLLDISLGTSAYLAMLVKYQDSELPYLDYDFGIDI